MKINPKDSTFREVQVALGRASSFPTLIGKGQFQPGSGILKDFSLNEGVTTEITSILGSPVTVFTKEQEKDEAWEGILVHESRFWLTHVKEVFVPTLSS